MSLDRYEGQLQDYSMTSNKSITSHQLWLDKTNDKVALATDILRPEMSDLQL